MTEQKELFVEMALNSWNDQLNRSGKLFDSLTDAELEQHVAPIPLLGLGDKLYPELEEAFVRNPESAQPYGPGIQQLRGYWNKVNQTLSSKFNGMSTEEWFDRHNSVSPEDFKKEPHRNKLNVLLSRTNHLSYHRGQLIFLQKK